MPAQSPGFQPRIYLPPTTGNAPFDEWTRQLTNVINSMPRVSWFSGTTPNSVVTGTPGDIAINLGSASTDTRAWIMGGAVTYTKNTGWVTLRTGPE